MRYAQPSLTPFGSAWNSFHPITILFHFYFLFFIFYFFIFFPVPPPYDYVAFSFLPPLSSPFSGHTVFAYPIRLAFALRPGHQD
jgi:hypothetical protein